MDMRDEIRLGSTFSAGQCDRVVRVRIADRVFRWPFTLLYRDDRRSRQACQVRECEQTMSMYTGCTTTSTCDISYGGTRVVENIQHILYQHVHADDASRAST